MKPDETARLDLPPAARALLGVRSRAPAAAPEAPPAGEARAPAGSGLEELDRAVEAPPPPAARAAIAALTAAARGEAPPAPAPVAVVDCRIDLCGAPAQQDGLCADHARALELGLLRLDAGGRHMRCLAVGCEEPPLGGGETLCAAHRVYRREGILELRRRRTDVPLEGRPRGRALAAAGLAAALAVGLAGEAVRGGTGRRPLEPRAIARGVAHRSRPAGDERRLATGTAGGGASGEVAEEDGAPRAAEGETDDEALLAAMTQGSLATRRRAVRALAGSSGGERAVSALVDALTADDPGTREEATRSLAAIHERGAPVDVLARALRRIEESRGGDRFQLIVSLGAIGRAAAVEPLCSLLDGAGDDETRRAAIEALGRTRDPLAARRLLQELAAREERGRMAGAGAADLRGEACTALGRAGSYDAVEALTAALEERDPRLRERAHRALEELTGERLGPDAGAWRAWWTQGTGEAYAHLEARIAASEAASGAARGALLRRIGAVRDARVLRAAGRALDDEDALVRRAAIAALASQRTVDAVPRLALALRDPVADVAVAAHRALVDLAGRDVAQEPQGWLDWWRSES